MLFLVDSSGSIGKINYKKMGTGMAAIVGGLIVGPTQVHVAAYTFDSEFAQHHGFGLVKYTTTAEVQSAIESLPYDAGSTFTGHAITWANSHVFSPSGGQRKDAQPVMVIITDGEPDDNVKAPANAAKAAGIKIFCIGVGNTYNLKSLQQMASTPFSDHIYGLKSYDPSEVAAEIIATACGNSTTATH